MKLSELTPAERSKLAISVGCSPKYLYQLATRWNNKRPSPDMARALVANDPRLTLEELLFPESSGSDLVPAVM